MAHKPPKFHIYYYEYFPKSVGNREAVVEMSLLIDYCQQCLFPLQSPTDAIFSPSLFPIVKSWTLIFTKASETCRTLDISLKSRRCFLAVILVSPIHSWKGSPLLSVLCLCGLWLSLWFAGASQLRVLLFEILCPTSCCQTSTSWLEKLNSAFQNKKTFFHILCQI